MRVDVSVRNKQGKIELLSQWMLEAEFRDITLYYKLQHLSHQTTEIPPIRFSNTLVILPTTFFYKKPGNTDKVLPPNNEKTANKIAATKRPLPKMKYL